MGQSLTLRHSAPSLEFVLCGRQDPAPDVGAEPAPALPAAHAVGHHSASRGDQECTFPAAGSGDGDHRSGPAEQRMGREAQPVSMFLYLNLSEQIFRVALQETDSSSTRKQA